MIYYIFASSRGFQRGGNCNTPLHARASEVHRIELQPWEFRKLGEWELGPVSMRLVAYRRALLSVFLLVRGATLIVQIVQTTRAAMATAAANTQLCTLNYALYAEDPTCDSTASLPTVFAVDTFRVAVAEAPWSVAEWAVALRFDNPRTTALVLVLG